eukprot:2709320-Prorocentrum_lima.AAC.1
MPSGTARQAPHSSSTQWHCIFDTRFFFYTRCVKQHCTSWAVKGHSAPSSPHGTMHDQCTG